MRPRTDRACDPRQNEDGFWKAEYNYVVNLPAIEVPIDKKDPGFKDADRRFKAIGIEYVREKEGVLQKWSAKQGRDQGHDEWELDQFCSLPAAKKAKLTRAEVAALRLYTGPAYTPLNAALRARDIAPWATTIAVCYSAVLKLSMLSKPTTVYRGVKEDVRILPDDFLNAAPGKFAGGTELAFTSCTKSPKVALQYAGKGPGSIFVIDFGIGSRGAAIQFLSQCAHEAEKRGRARAPKEAATHQTPCSPDAPRPSGFRTRRSCSSTQ
jgi:hypothetical protein